MDKKISHRETCACGSHQPLEIIRRKSETPWWPDEWDGDLVVECRDCKSRRLVDEFYE